MTCTHLPERTPKSQLAAFFGSTKKDTPCPKAKEKLQQADGKWGDNKEDWALKDWSFWTVVWEKTLESPLDCKEIQPVNPKGNQPWIFIGRTDAEASILGPPDAKSRLIRKDPDVGQNWRQEEKGTTKDKIVGWHHRLNRTWVWASFRSWWWTERPDMLQSTGLQTVGHDWRNELTDWGVLIILCFTSGSVIYFKLIFVKGVSSIYRLLLLLFFWYVLSGCSKPFVKKNIFTPLYCLCLLCPQRSI